MNFVMLSVNRTTPVFIILSENRLIFFGAYPSRIPVRPPFSEAAPGRPREKNGECVTGT